MLAALSQSLSRLRCTKAFFQLPRKDAESQYTAEVCSTVPNWTLFAVKNMKIDTALSDILKIDSSDTYFDDVTSVLRNEGAVITEYDK